MTNKEIQTIFEGLIKIKEDNLKLPIKVAFAISHNIKTLQPIIQEYVDARYEYLTKVGEIDKTSPDKVTIPADKVTEVTKQLTDLDNLEVSVSLVKINMEDLDEVDVTITMVEALEFMIEGES